MLISMKDDGKLCEVLQSLTVVNRLMWHVVD